ncbi:hypothetical protein BST61_g4683 [Cercospora zeina]
MNSAFRTGGGAVPGQRKIYGARNVLRTDVDLQRKGIGQTICCPSRKSTLGTPHNPNEPNEVTGVQRLGYHGTRDIPLVAN